MLSSDPGGRACPSTSAGPVRLMSTATVVVMTRSMAKNCKSPRLVLICRQGREGKTASSLTEEAPAVPLGSCSPSLRGIPAHLGRPETDAAGSPYLQGTPDLRRGLGFALWSP